MPIRVMHLTDSLVLGGKERMLVEIANASLVLGIAVAVCVTRSDLTLVRELDANVVIRCLERKSTFDLSGLYRFRVFVRAFQPDLFHAHGRSSFSFLAFAKQLGLISAPILLHDHHGKIETDQSVPFWFQRWGRHHVSWYVGVYRKLGTWAVKAGVPPEKISVIDNALNLQRIYNARPLNLRHMCGLPEDCLIGVAVGRISPEKGQDVLVQALGRCQNIEKLKILLVGAEKNEPYNRDVRAQIKDLGLEDSVLFLGARQDIPEILKGADFGILASRSESGPLVLIEYMASQLPFIVSRVGGISERVFELNLPGFVPAENPEMLARALDEMAALGTAERISRGAKGLKIAQDSFDIEKTIPQWGALYSQITGKT